MNAAALGSNQKKKKKGRLSELREVREEHATSNNHQTSVNACVVV